VRGKRVAMVDDVMSAGSALRGTLTELRSRGAEPVVAGALLVLGSTGADFFAANHIPVEAVERADYALWQPETCPLCTEQVALENIAESAGGSRTAPSLVSVSALANTEG
jgi:orotate phosphoribosyltransferase